MTMDKKRGWWLAWGIGTLASAAWAQPLPGLSGATSLSPVEHQFHAECHRPDTELCVVKSPGLSLYKVLTPGIPFDDLITHWVVDLRKFPPAPGAVKTLRVSGTSGEVYSIRMSLLYDSAALAPAARPAAQAKAAQEAKGRQDGRDKKQSPAVNANVANANVSQPSSFKPDGPPAPPPPTSTAESARPSSPESLRPSAGNHITPASGTTPATSAPSPSPSPNVPAAPAPAQQLPCLDGICIGASIKTLNAPFAPVISVTEQLRMNLNPSKRTPDIEERIAHLESLYRNGDVERFATEGVAWAQASREQEILKNLRRLRQAYAIALQALGGKHTPQVLELAKYFTPGGGGFFEANIKADPLVFVENRVLRFDQGLIDLLKKTKATFCGVYTLSGRYMSKSGYETQVELHSDADGEFRVSYIERSFSSPSLDSLLLLEQDLKQRYAPYIPAELVHAGQHQHRSLLLQLQLRHPVMISVLGQGFRQQLRTSFWQEGWMDFKGQELGIKKVMHAISERNKKEISMCKPQALSVE